MPQAAAEAGSPSHSNPSPKTGRKGKGKGKGGPKPDGKQGAPAGHETTGAPGRGRSGDSACLTPSDPTTGKGKGKGKGKGRPKARPESGPVAPPKAEPGGGPAAPDQGLESADPKTGERKGKARGKGKASATADRPNRKGNHFVGIPLPAAYAPLMEQLIGSVSAEARKQIRRVAPATYHLTVYFIGDLSAGAVPALQAELRAAFATAGKEACPYPSPHP